MDQGRGQQRRSSRYPFSAPAEVIPASGVPVGGKVTELSLYGCYLDSGAHLAPRTRVLVKIFALDGGYFEADATVVYSNPSLGTGLAFRQVRPEFLARLRKWLQEAKQQNQPGSQKPGEENQDPDHSVEE
jgi:PilZ domain